MKYRKGKDDWYVSTKVFAGYRIQREGRKGNDNFRNNEVLALDCMPSGWRVVIAIRPPVYRPYGNQNYKHLTREETWTLQEVLAFMPKKWHNSVINAHANRVAYDEAKVARMQSRLGRMQEQLKACTEET